MKTSFSRNALIFAAGAAAGAFAAFFLDAERGAYRRAIVRDGLASSSRRMGRLTRSALRDLRNRVSAWPHLFGSRSRHGPTDDLRLIERVRSKMGRYVSHPAAVQVGAISGVVTLSGPILRPELEPLLGAVRHVPGVQEIKDQLVVHDSADGIPALQGESPRPGERLELLEEDWSPGLRLAIAAGSGLLALYGLRIGGFTGGIATATSAALITRCATNRPLQQLPREARRVLQKRLPASLPGSAAMH